MATVSTNNLAQAIYQATEGKEGKALQAVVESTTRMLAEKHMLGRAPEILEALQQIIDKKDGVVRARIESSHKLSKAACEEIEGELKKRYKAKEVHLEAIIDERHLGGIKIQIADEIIDLTLANRISQLQTHLITH